MVDSGAATVRIAVLALQGDFERHIVRLRELGAEAFPARSPSDIDEADGVIVPGGESTTIGKLVARYGIDVALDRAHQAGKPIYGTCAGMILLAKEVAADTQERGGQPLLGMMNICVARNAYGRQVDSFEAVLHDSHLPGSPSEHDDLDAVFIRAPLIISHGDTVQVLARHDLNPVLVQEGSLLASSFHPELTADTRVHAYFLSMTRASLQRDRPDGKPEPDAKGD